MQEEAPALGKPVLVLRDVTERPEAVESGVVELIGISRESVFNVLVELNQNLKKYQHMARPVFPYGDGQASRRIVDALARFLMISNTGASGREQDKLTHAS